jgi:hypothetical protein
VLKYTVTVVGYQSRAPLKPEDAPVQVLACNKVDTECEQPVNGPLGALADAPAAYDRATRRWVINVPNPFDGFFLVRGDGYYDYASSPGTELTSDVSSPLPFQVLEDSAVDSFARNLGADPEGARANGVLAVQVLDCTGAPAENVQLGIRGELGDAIPWAAAQRIPVPGTASAPAITDRGGVAGFVLLRPVATRFYAIAPNGKTFGEQAFVPIAGRVTTGVIRPAASR